jgi:spore maturation protein CgeB
MSQPRMAFFGSSLVSAYWNGAATYYRGIIRALHRSGWDVTFFEPDAYERQAHRDIPDPDWATVVVYSGTDDGEVRRLLESLDAYDVIVKASGVGVFDQLLERAVPDVRRSHQHCVFWDVDAPATLDRLRRDAADPFHRCLPDYDLVMTYGGGPPVIEAYRGFGARSTVPVYNAVDPDVHYPVAADPRLAADISLLVNRLPDRETRVEELFLRPAERLRAKRFILGGNGWGDKPLPSNVRWIGHVPTADHNAFNCSSMAVLSINRDSMARVGYSPATRIFEAAGAGACIISDDWPGIDEFLEPGREVLTAAHRAGMVDAITSLDRRIARNIGRAARTRVLAEHTYDRRARIVEAALGVAAPVGPSVRTSSA